MKPKPTFKFFLLFFFLIVVTCIMMVGIVHGQYHLLVLILVDAYLGHIAVDDYNLAFSKPGSSKWAVALWVLTAMAGLGAGIGVIQLLFHAF